jgi:hypothetical protein
MRNQQQIRSNAGWNERMKGQSGAAKNGPALLAGLLRCGRCGRALQVTYTMSKRLGPLPRYLCNGDHGRQMDKNCITFSGGRVDQSVAVEVLEALRPLGVQAALDALDRSEHQIDEKRRSIELALEKARYEANRVERQYQAIEPENRLVAAELEKRWNNALRHVAEIEQRLNEVRSSAPQLTTQEQRAELLSLGDDLDRVWDDSKAPIRLKKRILRTVLQEIIADTTDDPPTVHLKLHWAGGSPHGTHRAEEQDWLSQLHQLRGSNGADSPARFGL